MNRAGIIFRPLYWLAGKLFSTWARPAIQPESPADLITDETATNTDAIGTGWVASVRGGLRMELTQWLSTLTELQTSYVRLSRESVTNTLPPREVGLVGDDLLLLRVTFSVRIGL